MKLAALALPLCFCTAGSTVAAEIRLEGWTARIDPERAAVYGRVDGSGDEVLIASGRREAIANIAASADAVSWRIASRQMNVRFSRSGTRLVARFETTKDQRLDWPETGDDAHWLALILPEGEGLYVPRGDIAWTSRLEGECDALSGGLSMPFFAYAAHSRTLSFHVRPELRSSLCFAKAGDHLTATLASEFHAGDESRSLEIDMGFGAASPIAPAQEYRERLIAEHRFVPLSAKIARNADVAKLQGAVHMYVWGDGRTPEFIADLVKMGVPAALISYDQDEFSGQIQAGPSFIKAAREAGFLVGPYDTFSNAQDPKTGDAASRWPKGFFRDGCIVERDGKVHAGFANRGCELSSEALARAELTPVQPLHARMAKSLRDGVNAYFVDVDAFGELFDDFSPAHPMTVFKDRENRMRRLAMARDRGVVLGSEEGVGWSVPLIDFAHGAFSTHNQTLWAEHKLFGPWWPPNRPKVFFQRVAASAEFREAKYDPTHRLPLYEAAFHDAIVATDRWEVPMAKFPALMPTREVLELLYGVPSIWAMDRQELRDSRKAFIHLDRFFAPLHHGIATQALATFEWLTPDRRVQRTRFGSTVLTANFGDHAFDGIGAGCIQARSTESGTSVQVFCPIGG